MTATTTQECGTALEQADFDSLEKSYITAECWISPPTGRSYMRISSQAK